MTTITAPAVTRPAPLARRPRLRGLTAERVFVTRSFIHAIRDVDTMMMAVLLPTMLMLMFTYIFGRVCQINGGSGLAHFS